MNVTFYDMIVFAMVNNFCSHGGRKGIVVITIAVQIQLVYITRTYRLLSYIQPHNNNMKNIYIAMIWGERKEEWVVTEERVVATIA
jgi:hypothetical protein